MGNSGLHHPPPELPPCRAPTIADGMPARYGSGWRNAMVQTHRPVMTHRRLLLFKWLMVVIPPVTVVVSHTLLGSLRGHPIDMHAESLLLALPILVLAYIFAETMFRVFGRLQAEALAREQAILTMNAVMQERERLSRELHDGVAQLVAHLLLRLDTIKELVGADRQREAEAELERLRGVADEIYEDIGESITGLRTNVAERGLIRTLRDYVDQFEERHQLPPLTAFQLFRLIQEALTNVRKHAAAQEATVTLTSNGPDQLRVVVADDGQGFTPGSQSSGKARPLGLTSMRERVDALGGTFQVNSQPGSGTKVTATFPIPRTRKENGHAALATPPS